IEARKHKQIGKFFGARHGVQGILKQDLVDLSAESVSTLEAVAKTPAAALGSVRKKPTPEECAEMFKVMQRLDVRYFFYIGGNDSAETANILLEVAKKENYKLHLFHIPKTIDNDLRVTDHCPGFGSAARFVAQAFMGDDLDNRSLPGVKINIVMGRHAGFLTAASVLGRARPDSGPHLVYVPERAFDRDKFVADVKKVMDKLGRCIVAASEGIQDKNGQLISAGLISGVDAHGNKQLSGSGALGDYLAELLKNGLGPKLRVRADTLGYLQRSFAGVVSEVDAREAREVGREAVRLAAKGVESGSISIIRQPGKSYKAKYVCTPLAKVAKVTKELAPSYINKEGNGITAAFENYARPLIGELPKVAFLKALPVKLL
ncbi:6-phosphofructokinase, partial [Candidatus Sumerlaeota bacterium]|nr:6-phosphofructokinase [Candidatus Sumerlaeota bacterium]